MKRNRCPSAKIGPLCRWEPLRCRYGRPILRVIGWLFMSLWSGLSFTLRVEALQPVASNISHQYLLARRNPRVNPLSTSTMNNLAILLTHHSRFPNTSPLLLTHPLYPAGSHQSTNYQVRKNRSWTMCWHPWTSNFPQMFPPSSPTRKNPQWLTHKSWQIFTSTFSPDNLFINILSINLIYKPNTKIGILVIILCSFIEPIYCWKKYLDFKRNTFRHLVRPSRGFPCLVLIRRAPFRIL